MAGLEAEVIEAAINFSFGHHRLMLWLLVDDRRLELAEAPRLKKLLLAVLKRRNFFFTASVVMVKVRPQQLQCARPLLSHGFYDALRPRNFERK